eukprot:CAMPEP_0195033962 /NCGR_PEP_ID=MMETSP0326_2-20130528/66794_1 /TAXON_ID=2866 ORGANISM="Crypthecodinium cohnii, Strain Seligo" /NCGR_SAMPLE_ID=MMETSP0326_2 /ASSEMBLY_ACC=CAM_ASM_000348 /LENGTH=105 /DNA_ID=CAMNT_0040058615 /DNA_START=26 /DNA_END=340 /DNA_ORIENTATION=+
MFGGPPKKDAVSMPGRFTHYEDGPQDPAEAVGHTFIANVDNLAQGAVHVARPRPKDQRPKGQPPLLVVHADPRKDLRINHYVNALGRKRCGDRLCTFADDTAAWA